MLVCCGQRWCLPISINIYQAVKVKTIWRTSGPSTSIKIIVCVKKCTLRYNVYRSMLISPLILDNSIIFFHSANIQPRTCSDNILYTINKYTIIHWHMNWLIIYLYIYDLIMKYSSKIHICLLPLLETFKTFQRYRSSHFYTNGVFSIIIFFNINVYWFTSRFSHFDYVDLSIYAEFDIVYHDYDVCMILNK